MIILDLIKELNDLKIGDVYEDQDLRNYTTYKAGGVAKAIVSPDNTEGLIKLLSFLKKHKIKHKVLGNGSNLIFVGKEYNGVLIKLDNFQKLEIDDNFVTVGAGYPLVKLALRTARMGLAGLEFAAGIPGTIGGAIFMNAGAYKSDMGYIVSTIKVLTPKLEVETLTNSDLDFHYRSSMLQKYPGFICLEATLRLRFGQADIILDVINDRKKRRIESQPLEYPSAGSVFRNPEGDYAGRLIEEIGYKGKNIGGAYVSDKHANFIINKDHASGEDIYKLIKEIKEQVRKKYKIELHIEQEIVK